VRMGLEQVPAIVAVLAALFLCLWPGEAGAADSASPGRIEKVAATPGEIVVTLNMVRPTAVRLVERRPYEQHRVGMPAVWTGTAKGRTTVRLPRRERERDRLFSKFVLTDATERPLGEPRYVTDLSGVGARDFPFPWPTSRKGITCPVGLDDVIATGTKYLNTNITLTQALDLTNPNPAETWEVDGERFPINAAYFRGLDAQIKRLTDAGVNVTVVINNPVPRAPDPKNPFIHPKTDLKNAPNRLGAFNLTDERGLRAYRAVLEYFAARYSRPDRRHGWITGYIVGNEIQAHWAWYNRGRVDAGTFLKDYATALRVTDLAVRKHHRGIRVYVSMDHHWALAADEPEKGMRGDQAIDTLDALTKAEGDFPWHVAFHPYPENLFQPAFWKDKTAVLAFDTPRITFKNLEVLPAFLAQKRLLYEGKPRRIILSEQGFHAADSPEGERLQAAAYAAAYYRVSRIPTIDAFMLHRHVSHRGEGGLRLGLWTWDPDAPDPSKPVRKMAIHEVYRQADTENWREAFAFALPLIGIADWKELDPAKRIAPARPQAADRKNVVADLIERRGTATTTNCLDWRQNLVAWDGHFVPTLFQHPPEKGVGDAVYRLTLPAAPAGKRLELRFGTGFTGATTNGVRFSVLVGGQEVWSATQTTVVFEKRTVDLTPFAEQEIELTLRVDGLGDIANDWANWAEPRIVVSP
jgi:hypothetical protein